MNWYYADGEQQKGPITETELDALAEEGIVGPGTLVWREGMAQWQQYSVVRKPGPKRGGAPPPPLPASSKATTDESAPVTRETVLGRLAEMKQEILRRLEEAGDEQETDKKEGVSGVAIDNEIKQVDSVEAPSAVRGPIQAGEGTARPVNPSGKSTPKRIKRVAKLTGECQECQHLRIGCSTASSTFDAILDLLKPGMRATHTQKLQEERSVSGEFALERENNREHQREDYHSRPTVPKFAYCGVHEFQGNHYCTEVKNLDNACTDFLSKKSEIVRHHCKSCRHYRKPFAKLVQVVEQITGSNEKGQRVREEIRETLRHQAENEYQACVDAVGMLNTRPGLLPVCESYSSPADDAGEARYVVGPVINVAGLCPRWEEGSNAASAQIQAELDALLTRAKRAAARENLPSPDDVLGQQTKHRRAAANAQADVIEYCLKVLGVDADCIDSICGIFTADVYYSEREKGAFSGSAPAAVDDAPSQPFLVQMGVNYFHPEKQHIYMVLCYRPPFHYIQAGIVTGNPQYFDLANLQIGVWTRLTELPIQLCNNGPNGLLAMWL